MKVNTTRTGKKLKEVAWEKRVWTGMRWVQRDSRRPLVLFQALKYLKKTPHLIKKKKKTDKISRSKQRHRGMIEQGRHGWEAENNAEKLEN